MSIPDCESGRSRSGESGRSSTRLFLLTLGLLAAASVPIPPRAAPSAAEILRRAEEIRSPELDYAVDFTLDVKNPRSSWKHRTAEYTMIAHGKDYSLVLMRSPESFYPGTLLITKGLYWMLLPRSTRPFQLSPRHVLNGDISNGDLARGNLIAYYEPRLDGEEKVHDRDCWRLELTRTRNLGLYPRIRCWITKRGFRPWKFEYYGQTGALLKVVYYEDFRNGELGSRAMRIVVQNHARQGERTIMTFSNLRKIDASRLSFDRESLITFRDAALAKLEAEGVQAQPEELLAQLGADRP